MKLHTVKSEGLAHNSYFLSDNGEAAVIDPRRDCQIYTRLARKECAEIRYILETHRNEDYVVGSLELQDLTGAEIGHSKELNFKYGEHNLSDGETLSVGNLRIKALHTPGHTDESLCYAVYTPERGAEPFLVFSGDTLFVGSVGRTDLYGAAAKGKQAEKLHASLHEKLLPLGDHVFVYPAHGAGSVCGSGISAQEFSTLGYEKKTNPYLQLTKEAFVDAALRQEMLVPPYFRQMEEYNLNGAPLLSELAFPRALSLADFEEEMQEPNMALVDTRMPNAFAASHIPGSFSIWLGGTSVYPGWFFDVKQYFLFVHERASDIGKVARRFRRIGFDNMCGFLCRGMGEWQDEGKPLGSVGVLSAAALRAKLDKGEVRLLDVREPGEWKEEGYVVGAERVFVGYLQEKADGLPRDKPVAVTCSVGNRSGIGASILKRKGFSEVYNVMGGMTAWRKLGFPVKKD